MIRAVFFDMDGTLVDSLPFCMHTFQLGLLPVLGYEIGQDTFFSHLGLSEEGMIRRIVGDADYAAAYRSWARVHQALHATENPSPLPGTMELLTALKDNGILIGLITGRGKCSLSHSLTQFGMQELFDVIKTGDPDRPIKTQCLKDACKALFLAPSEVIYVGDSPGDVTSSREVGMHTVAVTYASTCEKEALLETNPDAAFDSVEALRDYLFLAANVQ